MILAIEYLLNHRYSEDYGLIFGATTFDWGDVQVEGGTLVDVDDLSHWSINIYGNAMFIIALNNLKEIAFHSKDKQRWGDLKELIKVNSKKYLWDVKGNKFIPHIYIKDSPFSEDFDENAIHYHGGTAVAIEAGILNKQDIAAVLAHMVNNVKLSGASSIGLTLYPPYPVEVLGKDVSRSL